MVDSNYVVKHASANAHKQQRALVTRRELLQSARTIFARDGFEHARLADIAANVGRTRGALYVHFKDKEDLFCTMFEDGLDRDVASLAALLTGLSSKESRVEALGRYLVKLSKDRERMLLTLEFKLYAIRHPLKRKRLASLHRMMCLRCSIPEIDQVFPSLAKRSDEARLTTSLAVGGMVDGLALNHLFEPDVLNDQALARYLKLCLRGVLLDSLVRSPREAPGSPVQQRGRVVSKQSRRRPPAR